MREVLHVTTDHRKAKRLFDELIQARTCIVSRTDMTIQTSDTKLRFVGRDQFYRKAASLDLNAVRFWYMPSEEEEKEARIRTRRRQGLVQYGNHTMFSWKNQQDNTYVQDRRLQ